jgi:predicted O-methyltransferase YrrM
MTFDELLGKARAYQESRILLTAIELDLFTAVGDGATAEDVSRRIGTSVRGTRLLLDAVAAMGGLTKTGATYRNTPETRRYLVAGSPEYAQPGLMHSVNLWKTWTSLTDAVRAGTSVLPPGVEARDERWTENFIAAMHRNGSAMARVVVSQLDLSPARTLLDIGGGSGAYAIVFAQANPDLTTVLFDLPHVLPLAERYIGDAGLSHRISTRARDLRTDDFSEAGQFDLVLLSNICHMLDESENRDLLRRCFPATAPGGRIVIRDFIINDDRTSPPQAALFALNMLVGTRGGSTYSEAEYTSWLLEAGFERPERPSPTADLVIAHRAALPAVS